MAEDKTTPPNDEVVAVSDEALQKAESFIEEEEGAANRLMGWVGNISTAIAVVMSLFHLYAAYAIVPTQELRSTHVAFVLFLCFLLFPLATRFRHRVRWWDVVPGLVAVATIVYRCRAATTSPTATPRPTAGTSSSASSSSCWCSRRCGAPPAGSCRSSRCCSSPMRCSARSCRRRGPTAATTSARLVGHLYMTLEGIFGVAVDVSSSLIILFTIYGAFLQQSGAGKFFIDFSLALMGGKPNGAGRTVVLASFLLGGRPARASRPP